MEKKIDVVVGSNSRRVDITLSRNGRISLSSHVSKVLDLSVNAVVDVAIDTEEGEYYLFRRLSANDTVGRHEGMCYATSKKSPNNLRMYSKAITDTIFSAVNPPKGTNILRLWCGSPIALDGIASVALPIITRKYT